MSRRSKLRVVHRKNILGPISSLSPEEQARLLDLADVALRTKKPDHEAIIGGARAHQEHELLKRDIKDAVEKFECEPLEQSER